MRFLLLIFVLAVVLGCQAEPEPPSAPEPDPSMVEFHTRMDAFLDEARSACRLLEMMPPLAEYHSKCVVLTDIYTRIPEGTTPGDAGARRLAKKLLGSLRMAELAVRGHGERLAMSEDQHADKAGCLEGAANFKDIATDIATENRALIDELAQAMDDYR